jgi:hypothetical protein
VIFERRHEPLIGGRAFAVRVAKTAATVGIVVGGGLGIGVLGYHWLAGLDWIDSLLNASMILTGMGPVNPMSTVSAKLFASAYALFSGVLFLSSVGVLLAPFVHRSMHRFHLEEE